MAHKRPRSAFEEELQGLQSPYVSYGTPLPPLDDQTRDDGSYVPVWKQEVTDERGRKRLHGAFTGGFSAGYFNTVGSKDGWAPSSFVSSRTNRRKDDKTKSQQRPEDFMDDEDLAEAAEAQSLQTSETFAGLGTTGDDDKRRGFLMDVFKTEGETMGVKLLRKMGWRDGQGIGPRVQRKAQLQETQAGDNGGEDYLFAPTNSRVVSFDRKEDRKGLGYSGQPPLSTRRAADAQKEADDDQADFTTGSGTANAAKKKGQAKPKRGAFGVGVLNDSDGEGDDDPYEMGPRLSYNRVIGGDKRKDKTKMQTAKPSANPLLNSKPVFTSKRSSTARESLRKCHDGRPPVEGFVVVEFLDPSAMALDSAKYPKPQIPEGWKSSKEALASSTESANYQSTADAAKLSRLDHKSRAQMLGEAQLPGKSIFDFLTPAARERLVVATGKTDLPVARNEAPPVTEQAIRRPVVVQETFTPQIPDLDRNLALAALGRGVGGWMPYMDDDAKRSRYRNFLEFKGGIRSQEPERPKDMRKDHWIKELQEFAHAAEVFKPMTGSMASRFTTSSTAPSSTGDPEIKDPTSLLSMPSVQTKPEDPAEAAAKMGMFGPVTRSEHQFYPTRLVCKRFNVRPPDHVGEDGDSNAARTRPDSDKRQNATAHSQTSDLISQATMDEIIREAAINVPTQATGHQVAHERVEVDTSKNDALEGPRPGEALFKSIFGSDDEDDA